ncbi:MAG TPA: hypothetical protein DIS62_03135 [Candidatus Kerfeldbacteria bacterium]|nr:MAG: hypothetical protein UY34_C0023G0028 [Parcubacteria group bacterium GW2011_GWA2_48_9]KKW15952.1 MAG: hypothetical protein UY52_C0012G0039 [Parcubacteria group bacterium GW2011_GWC2_49_9]HCJ52940.1 hypothetical protein [Candidatus Kerfeldbacteria bacterium]HCM67970.1 hypothetical protein [Candidatus Kerfeldbacteria bacterium]
MSTTKDIVNRLHRTQGQLQAVERMLSEQKSCTDVMMQLMAAKSSIEQTAILMLQDETRSCLKSPNAKDRERLNEVAATLFKYT